MDIAQGLCHYVKNEARVKAPANLDVDYDLIGSGVVDSLFMTLLITHIEDSYKIEFELQDIVPQNFRTIGDLSALVNRKLAVKG